jgi:hypothetical protein
MLLASCPQGDTEHEHFLQGTVSDERRGWLTIRDNSLADIALLAC